MAYRSCITGVTQQLGVYRLWDFAKHSKSDRSVDLEYGIKRTITNVFELYLQLPRKNVKTRQRSAEEKKFKIPILLGNFFLIPSKCKIAIVFNCFLDFQKLNFWDLRSLYLRMGGVFLGISKSLKKKISISSKNLFYLSNSIETIAKKEPVSGNMVKVRQYLRPLLLTYKLSVFRRNQYYRRVSDVFIASFIAFDTTLLAKSVSQELANLRKFHRKFISMVTNLSRFCYHELGLKVSKEEPTIKLCTGFRVRLKGRLTFSSKQIRRKKKVWINLGKIGFSAYKKKTHFSQQLAINRFGTISVRVWSTENDDLDRVLGLGFIVATLKKNRWKKKRFKWKKIRGRKQICAKKIPKNLLPLILRSFSTGNAVFLANLGLKKDKLAKPYRTHDGVIKQVISYFKVEKNLTIKMPYSAISLKGFNPTDNAERG